MLATNQFCEIGDLIGEVTERTAKTFDAVESAFFDAKLYPEGYRVYISAERASEHPGEWLFQAIFEILRELNLEGVYIVE